jgi:hypothetical protein
MSEVTGACRKSPTRQELLASRFIEVSSFCVCSCSRESADKYCLLHDKLRPDILLLDLRISKKIGQEVASEVMSRKAQPNCRADHLGRLP